MASDLRPRIEGGVDRVANSAAGTIAFVLAGGRTARSVGEHGRGVDRLDRGGAFKRSHRRGIRRRWSR